MKAPKKRKLLNKRGISLAELMCAVLIMSISVSATARALATSYRSITLGYCRDRASAISQEYCDVIMSYIEYTPSIDPGYYTFMQAKSSDVGSNHAADTYKNALFAYGSEVTNSSDYHVGISSNNVTYPKLKEDVIADRINPATIQMDNGDNDDGGNNSNIFENMFNDNLNISDIKVVQYLDSSDNFLNDTSIRNTNSIDKQYRIYFTVERVGNFTISDTDYENLFHPSNDNDRQSMITYKVTVFVPYGNTNKAYYSYCSGSVTKKAYSVD